MKNIIMSYLKVFKHLFYDIIPQFYNVRWFKNDFDSKLKYYYWLPFRYILLLIISLFDFEIAIYRIGFILGFMKQSVKDFKGILEND